MQFTRREFVQAACASAMMIAGGGLTKAFGQKETGELFPVPPEAYADPLFSMTAKRFEPFIGNSFTVRLDEGRSVRVVLTEVNSLERSQNTIRGYYGDCFSLIFEGPKKNAFDQGTYEMQIDGLADFSALLVPTGQGRRQYELIVNRVGR